MDPSDFKEYLSIHNIHELFKGLMFGLILSKPTSPVEYLIKSLQNVQELDLDTISWKDFFEGNSQISKALIEPRSNITFVEVPGLMPEGKFPDRVPSLSCSEENVPLTMKPVVLILGAPESEKLKFAQTLREGHPNWVIVSRFTYTVMKFITMETLKETPMDKTFIQRNLSKCPDARCFIVVDYPVTTEQMTAFENCINPDQIIIVVYIHIEEDLSIRKCLAKMKQKNDMTGTIPGMIALNIQTFQQRINPVIEHYKRIKRFVHIDEDSDLDTVILEIRELIKDSLDGKTREEIQESLQCMSVYKDLGTPGQVTQLPSNISFYPTFPKCPLIILIGLPGCQKTLHASELAAKYHGLDFLSVGQMACNSISYINNPDCSQWKTVTALIRGEELIPQFDVIDVISKKVEDAVENKKSVILIGYPKNSIQLDEFNTKIGLPTIVIHLDCPEREAVNVLLERSERSTHSVNNLLAITNEINCFEKHTLPVIYYYKTMSRLITMNIGNKSFSQVNDEIYQEILKYLPRSIAKVSLANSIVIFVVGGPGSGKGTQCAKIVSKYGFTHLSSGDLLREEVASGSSKGKELNSIMESGQLVSMDTVLELIKDAMMSRAAISRGFLIDGYPRELEQGKRFEAEVAPCMFVLNFDVSDETMKNRLHDRAKTSGRVDDNEETIMKRLQTFHDHTTPVIDYYNKNNKLQTIKAEGGPDEVFSQVEVVFKQCCPQLKPCLDECKVIFVVGGPGSGKGTMCAKLAQVYGFCHLSSGDLLREEVASESPRGKELKAIMRKGQLVPLEVVLQLLKEAMIIKSAYTKCFLLDGYPRELQQGIQFETEITECACVLNFTAPDDVLVKRLLERGKTSGRDDDNKGTIMKRLETFHNITQPVIDYFEDQKKVININADNTVNGVFEHVKEAMKPFAS